MKTKQVLINNMEMYNQVKKQITSHLQDEKVLEEDTIKNIIIEWKTLIKITPAKTLKTFLAIKNEEDIRPLKETEWDYMQKELEEQFQVRMTTGILVRGQGQRNRKDLTWWTSKKQLEVENYYHNNYKKLMESSLPMEVIKNLDEDTNVIMNNLSDPQLEDFSIYGMVVGHVQSGKTSNYASLICKAADAGYRFIVVIAGAQNNLRDQTQKRMDEAFIGSQYEGVGMLPNFKREKMPHSLTNSHNDFKIETAKASKTTNFDNMKLPILVVIKKHTKPLSNLLEWLDSHYRNEIDKAMLVIDDESDYASINTNEVEDPTTINRKIRKLLGKFRKKAYIAYTATPFANIFIDDEATNESVGKDLFPEDFIYALDAPSNYFGAAKVFGNEKNNKKFVVEIPETEVQFAPDDSTPLDGDPLIIRHKKEYSDSLEYLPDSLHDAVRLFIINIAIRNLRNQRKHNSMLIHVSRFTDVHIKIKSLVEYYFEGIKEDIEAYGALSGGLQHSKHIQELEKTFDNRLPNVEFDFKTVLAEICHFITTILIRDVHQKSKVKLEYRDDIQTNVIVIGGLSLSRGFTIEGLTVSYFLRTTIYYDTLMQMGRWFGYRIGYEDLCRVYLTEDMNEKFGFIIEATDDLVNRLKDMQEENLTPKDFGLAVKMHPDSLLQVTARNKSKNTEDMYLQMSLDGQLKETRWISNKEKDIRDNEDLLKMFVQKLGNKENMTIANKSYVWKEVDKEYIQEFVRKYKFYSNDPLGIKSRMPVVFIKEYIKNSELDWDVVLFNGNSEEVFSVGDLIVQRQRRSVKEKESYWEVKNRQLSRALPEKIIMPKDKENKNLSSREMRKKLERPLLMIHALEIVKDMDETYLAVGFSISFPIKNTRAENSVKVRINNVYKRQLEEAFIMGEEKEYYDASE